MRLAASGDEGRRTQTRTSFALVALLCVALWLGPGDVRAQTPAPLPDLPAASSPARVTPAASPSSGAIAILFAAIASLGLLALWLVRRAWQRPDLTSDDTFEPLTPAPLIARPSAPPPARQLIRAAAAERGLVSAGGAAPKLAAELLMLASRAEERKRECPSCKRRWSSWMVVCPVDGASLGPVQQTRAPRIVGRGEATMPRLVCHGCGRRYEQGAQFCAHDGHELLHDTPEEAASAPSFIVCRTCGRASADGKPCGCKPADRDQITICPVEASADSARLPAVPLTVCPRCNRYGKPGQLHCDHDQALLLPVTDIHTQTFPHTGYGPRRKVCRKCGAQFSSACSYCCHDGEALSSLD